MAAAALQAKGGVDGRKLIFKQVNTPFDPVGGQLALDQAAADKPTGIIGGTATSLITALAKQTNSLGIPTIYLSTVPQAYVGQPDGSKWAFLARVKDELEWKAMAAWVGTNLKPSSVGFICAQTPLAIDICNDLKTDIKLDGNPKVVGTTENALTATDMTAQVRAMAGAGAVYDLNAPAPAAIAANQLVQNGIGADHIVFDNIAASVSSGAVSKGAAAKLWEPTECAPTLSTEPADAAFSKAYQMKWGAPADDVAAISYDDVMLFADAVSIAHSTAPQAVATALRSLTYNGICGTYHSDSTQTMLNTAVVVHFNSQARPVIVGKLNLG